MPAWYPELAVIAEVCGVRFPGDPPLRPPTTGGRTLPPVPALPERPADVADDRDDDLLEIRRERYRLTADHVRDLLDYDHVRDLLDYAAHELIAERRTAAEKGIPPDPAATAALADALTAAGRRWVDCVAVPAR